MKEISYSCIEGSINVACCRFKDCVMYACEGGVYIRYTDKTGRWISNSWYDDINTDNL